MRRLASATAVSALVVIGGCSVLIDTEELPCSGGHGPLAVAFYGGDELATGSGFYERIDTNQGTATFWVTPQTAIADLEGEHVLLQLPGGQQVGVEAPSGDIFFRDGGHEQVIAKSEARDWQAGEFHFVAVRWDSIHVVAPPGLNSHVVLNVDQSQPFFLPDSIPYTPNQNGAEIVLGSRRSGDKSFFVVERVIIDRRPISLISVDLIREQRDSGNLTMLGNSSFTTLFASYSDDPAGECAGDTKAWSARTKTDLMLGDNLLMRGYDASNWRVRAGSLETPGLPPPGKQVFAGAGVALGPNSYIEYDLDIRGVDSLVVGAVVHVETDGAPDIQVLDADGLNIGRFLQDGYLANRVIDPQTIVVSGNTTDNDAFRYATVIIGNSAAGGKVYIDSVFAYSNMLENPSFEDEAIAGQLYTPPGWTMSTDLPDGVLYVDAGEQYAGGGAIQVVVNDSSNPHTLHQAPESMEDGGIYVAGASVKWESTASGKPSIAVSDGSLFRIYADYASGSRMSASPDTPSDDYQHISVVGKRRRDPDLNSQNDNILFGNAGFQNSTSDFFLDNTYVVRMDDVFPE